MGERSEEGGVVERNAARETVVAWLVIFLLVLVMLGRAAFGMLLIGDRGQRYDYRTVPLVPASAYASTQPSPSATTTAPQQVPLPPATVGKRAK